MKKISILFLTLSACTQLLLSCNHAGEQATERHPYIIPDSVLHSTRFDTTQICPVKDAITLTGSVDFDQDHQVNIFPLVSGIVQDIKVQPGDQVQAGQVLAVVKSSEMAGYSSNLITAESNLAVAKKNLEAQKDLYKSGLSSQLDVTAAQSNYDQAAGQLEMVRRVLKINGNNTQGDYIVKSPINGFIVQRNVSNNTMIRTDNGTSLFTISDLRQVWVQANVYESNIDKVHVGDSVQITTVSYPNRVFRGKIDKVMNVLDPSSKVMKVRIILPNPDYLLKPQMFTRSVIYKEYNQQSVCVSASSLVYDHSQYYVLVYQGKGIAEIRPVEVQSMVANKAYLSAGVKEGEVLVSSNSLLIYDALNN